MTTKINQIHPPGKSDNDSAPAFCADTHDPTGFPNRTDSAWTFTNSSRLFSIQPVATSFTYYEAGKKYTSQGDTITITDVQRRSIVERRDTE